MIRKYFTLLFIGATLFSCSTDQIAEDLAEKLAEDQKTLEDIEAEQEEQQAEDKSSDLFGVWQATEVQIDDQTASDTAKFGKQILDHLTEKECHIIEFTFNEDLSVVAKNSAQYLEINVGGSGLDVPCPTEEDSHESVYSYDGEVLTYLDSDGSTMQLDATVEDDVLTIDAAQLDIDNFDASGQLIFEKKI